MLRTIVKCARFIDHVREKLRVTRRKAVVAAVLNVQQLVEWIAVRHPRRAFLVGCEQIAAGVEAERDREANPRREYFMRFEIGGDANDCAIFVRQPILRFAVFVVQQRIGEIGGAAAVIHAAIAAIVGNTQPIDLMEAFFPAADDFNFLVGSVVAIRIDDQRNESYRPRIRRCQV